jgi:hypothetical protein
MQIWMADGLNIRSITQNFSIDNQLVAPMACLDLVIPRWLPIGCPQK